MENKRFLEPFLLEELEIILRKKEQVLQELNGQLRGMRGGSLHVKHRNGRVYYCEYGGMAKKLESVKMRIRFTDWREKNIFRKRSAGFRKSA